MSSTNVSNFTIFQKDLIALAGIIEANHKVAQAHIQTTYVSLPEGFGSSLEKSHKIFQKYLQQALAAFSHPTVQEHKAIINALKVVPEMYVKIDSEKMSGWKSKELMNIVPQLSWADRAAFVAVLKNLQEAQAMKKSV